MNNIHNLTIVIVTYRTDEKILTDCLNSIDPQINILIVENSKNNKNKWENGENIFMKKRGKDEHCHCHFFSANKKMNSFVFAKKYKNMKISSFFIKYLISEAKRHYNWSENSQHLLRKGSLCGQKHMNTIPKLQK
mgnify:CR=1 FL=1